MLTERLGGRLAGGRTARGLVAGVLAAVSLVAAACNGVVAPPGRAPIRIGSITPVSGVGLVFPNAAAALRAAARDLDAHGGIHGRPVEIDNCDDRNDPNLAEACARRLVSDGVVATAGDDSQFGMVEAPVLDAAGIAQVGDSALTQEEVSLPTSFPFLPGLPGYVAGEVAGMKLRGLHRLFVVGPDVAAAQVTVQFAALAGRAADVSVVGTAAVPLPATDVSPWVQQAMRSGAQVVMLLLPNPLTLAFAAASERANAGYLVAMTYGTLLPGDIRRLGGARSITENDVEFAALPPLSAADRFPALATFQSDMDAELAAGDAGAARELRSSGTLDAWLSVQVVAGLAGKLRTVSARTVLQALRSGQAVDTMGLTPPWFPGRSGPRLFPRITNPSGYFATQRGGVETLVDPTPFNSLQALQVG